MKHRCMRSKPFRSAVEEYYFKNDIFSTFFNSSLRLHWAKPHCKQTKRWDTRASTSRRLAPARSFATSWGERLYLWGLFSPTHLFKVLLLQDYKDFQMHSVIRNKRFFLSYRFKLKKKASVPGLKKLLTSPALQPRRCVMFGCNTKDLCRFWGYWASNWDCNAVWLTEGSPCSCMQGHFHSEKIRFHNVINL